MAARQPRWRIQNYRDASGHDPVDAAFEALAAADLARVVHLTDLLAAYGTALKMPHAGHLQGKLWELRMDGRPNSYRVIYAAVRGHTFLLLHLFAKKTPATLAREIATAGRRLTDYEQRTKP